MKTIEFHETTGHVLTVVQVLAPMMRPREIASIDAVCLGKPRNAPKRTWVLMGVIK